MSLAAVVPLAPIMAFTAIVSAFGPDRPAFDRRGSRHRRDGSPDQPFDRTQVLHFVAIAERNGRAFRARAGGAADAMHVRFRFVRQIVINDVRDAVDVDPAACDVGCDQHGNLVGREIVERALPRVLSLVAMDCFGPHAARVEVSHDAIGAVLGAREHEHLLPVASGDQMGQELALAARVDGVSHLRDQIRRRVARRRLNDGGRIHERAGQRLNLVRGGGGEQQVLPLRRQQAQDASDVADEAEIQHAVRLVENQDFDTGKVDGALLNMVKQSPRRGHHYVHSGPQGIYLGANADPAVDGGAAQR
jgi:hypothetical protein